MFSSHTKEWHAVFNGTKEEGRKAIRSLFGPNNKWGYDATGKPFFLWNPLKASSGTVRTRIVQSLDAPSCEGQFLYSKFQNFSQPKYKIFLVDLPANSLWQTLRDEFPEAKVILVVRDDQKWINSLQNHLVVSFFILVIFRSEKNLSGQVSRESIMMSFLGWTTTILGNVVPPLFRSSLPMDFQSQFRSSHHVYGLL